jgi:hypothetical protein
MTKRLAVRILTLTTEYFGALAEVVALDGAEPAPSVPACQHPPDKRTPMTMGGKCWQCECGYLELPEE